MPVFDLAEQPLRALNAALHASGGDNGRFEVLNPRGAHSVAVGVEHPCEIEVMGPVGYYCGGMNEAGEITVRGSAGPGLAENMMGGRVVVEGDASQYAGATGHGGLLVIRGSAASRCGISLKGLDIVVGGSIGHMSAFMAQSGRMVVLGDAGEALGDSIYEARIYVRGTVKSLGTDCIEKPMRDEHRAEVADLLEAAGIAADPADFRRYGSARKLYHFDVDHADAY